MGRSGSVLLLGNRLRMPHEILDAQRDGRLVVFAGAGVSKEEPSGLPLFHDLVREIARRDLEDAEKERPDQLLGKLADENVDVHSAAKRILGRVTSQPASGHRSLVDLFRIRHELRIVTTNLDHHFTTILREVDPAGEVEIYYAPALPPGNDFRGLVYLHGSIDKDPKRMVLTDRDFGSAYLTDAYAARFLERMFAEFTVLFVGYSHRDFMMEFLARGLSRHQKRFALTGDDSPDAESFWRRLGVEPIYYSKQPEANRHEELWAGLAKWAKCSQASPSAVERRIREITATRPEFVSPTDISYLEWQLRGILGARFFNQHAKDSSWLIWLEGQPGFETLCTPDGEAGPIGCTLAEWFCEHFVIGDAGALGLAAVERHKPHLHPALWHRVVRTLAYAEKREPQDIVGKWIGMLLSSWHPTYDCDLLGHILSECRLPEEHDFVVLLFDFLTKPRVKLERTLGPELGKSAAGAKPRSALDPAGNPLQLLEFVERKIRGNEGALFDDLIPIVEHHLLVGHRLLLVSRDASAAFDEVSFRRAAIEPHEQNGSPQATDALIDAASVLLEWAAAERPHLLDAYVERWAESPVPLLRRLAVYATARRIDRSADERLQWVLDHDLLFALSEKHEVFCLLETAFAQASPPLQRGVLEAVTASTSKAVSLPERIPSDYERYNVLVWLSRCAPNVQSVSDALVQTSEMHPEFAPREHPDLGHEMKIWFVPGPTEDEVADVLAMHPPEALAWVEACRDAPRQEDACYTRPRTVEAAAAKSVTWGLSLAAELAQKGDTDPGLWAHMIDGFRSATMTPREWGQILALLAKSKNVQAKRSLQIAWLLRDGVASTVRGRV